MLKIIKPIIAIAALGFFAQSASASVPSKEECTWEQIDYQYQSNQYSWHRVTIYQSVGACAETTKVHAVYYTSQPRPYGGESITYS